MQFSRLLRKPQKQKEKPDQNPAKRIRSGKEEQRNEREMTFGAKQKSRRKRYEACDDAWCRRRLVKRVYYNPDIGLFQVRMRFVSLSGTLRIYSVIIFTVSGRILG